MTPSDPLPSRGDVTARVRDVDGVADVFSSTAGVRQLPHVLVARVTGATGRVDAVEIAEIDESPVATARIGTRRETSTCVTARRVADVLMAEIGDDPGASVNVTVVRIGD